MFNFKFFVILFRLISKKMEKIFIYQIMKFTKLLMANSVIFQHCKLTMAPENKNWKEVWRIVLDHSLHFRLKVITMVAMSVLWILEIWPAHLLSNQQDLSIMNEIVWPNPRGLQEDIGIPNKIQDKMKHCPGPPVNLLELDHWQVLLDFKKIF